MRATYVLASASPRRVALLRALGLDPEVVPSGVDETLLPGEGPAAHVGRLAAAKGRAIASRVRGRIPPAIVVSADTAVVLEGRILGKPADDAQALEMLRALSGRVHEVLTALRVERTDDGRSALRVAVSRVRFRAVPESLLRWYVSTGEPRDKAGAYGLQGFGVLLTDGIEGSWSNVVGLPLEALPELLAEIGVDLFATIPVP
ncbi:MAG TPA: Maf family protein [Candidatus Polarisedimenticolaceae bacterium]